MALLMLAAGGPFEPAEPCATGRNLRDAAKGIRILPGQWRPHYPFSKSRGSARLAQPDYRFDFPRRSSQPRAAFQPRVKVSAVRGLPRVAWQEIPDGLAFERTLPNEFVLAGSGAQDDHDRAQLHIENGSRQP